MKDKTRMTLQLIVIAAFITIVLPVHGTEFSESGEGRQAQLPVFAIEAEEGYPYLLEQMRGKRAILLGDGSHGTEEFYSFRKRITKDLVSLHGYRALVLEAEWDSAELVDNYVRGLTHPEIGPREILKEAFSRWPEWVWANEEMAEFVLWLKEYNSNKVEAEMVRVFGMDMQMAVSDSLLFLRDALPDNPRLKSRLEALVYWWEPYIQEPAAMHRAYVDGRETGNLLATEILMSLKNPEPKIENVLKMLIAVEDYYRNMSFDQHAAWNIRSQYFSSYVQSLLQTQAANNGIVAWAHNSHVGDMRGAETGEEKILSFGMLMRQSMGAEQVYLLGSTSYSGSVIASTEWGLEPTVVNVPVADVSSVEHFINGGGWSNPLILFENDEQRKQWTFAMPHRGIGVVYNPEIEFPDNYLTSRIGHRYDAMVFWQKTKALQLLQSP